MNRLILSIGLFSCSSLSAPQFNGDSSLAKILQEQRFNAGGGKFGSAFAQEDGVVFREESSGNNNRIGEYSFTGDDGVVYTTKYSAGPDGFRILSGDHIPSGGQNSAPNVVEKDANGEDKEYDYEYYDDAIPDSPFVNKFDPTHQTKFLLAGDLGGFLAQRKFTTPAPALPGQLATEAPHRFFPAGNIQLERFQEGFNFNFKSQ